jgi:histidinol-phosphate aminotransferase
LRPALAELGMECLPTQANFVAVSVGGDDVAYFEAMLREGVIVFPGTATEMPGYIRLTIGTPPELERFLAATRKVKAAQAQA